ncbi:MAG TPA: hypothetical protein VGF92_00520 [Stellaceae bacterium]|jgi:ferric-dicitrate binding protein FerR (iron transport regulator)
MTDLDPAKDRPGADWATLYWWRRDGSAGEGGDEAARLSERLDSLVERAPAPMPDIDSTTERLRAYAAAPRSLQAPPAKELIALDRDLAAAIRNERRGALAALAIGLIATAVSMAAAIYAAIIREPVALGFATAAGATACFALYHAARWFLLTRSDALPNLLA